MLEIHTILPPNHVLTAGSQFRFWMLPGMPIYRLPVKILLRAMAEKRLVIYWKRQSPSVILTGGIFLLLPIWGSAHFSWKDRTSLNLNGSSRECTVSYCYVLNLHWECNIFHYTSLQVVELDSNIYKNSRRLTYIYHLDHLKVEIVISTILVYLTRLSDFTSH